MVQFTHRKLFISFSRWPLILVAGVLVLCSLLGVSHAQAADTSGNKGRLVTFHDRGERRVVLTHAQSIEDALKAAKITLSSDDVVEPKRDTKLVASDYTVNIYRARPVIVVDGALRQKIMTAAQTSRDIVMAAKGELKDEDDVTMEANPNLIADGAGILLTIDRATPFTLKLYGKAVAAYTQATTVGGMLKEKDINLAANDTISSSTETAINAGMTVEIWREGVQTVTLEEAIPYPVRSVIDADQPVGYKEVQVAGAQGKKNVVYEITASSGKEVSRKAIHTVVITQSKEQVEVIGAKPAPHSLTKAKGAHHFTDSKGIVHRETYYDLPMNIVMGACGGGGYTVRSDGAKVDKNGYVLIAANLTNYPKCSVVETSMGPGKVYDTGGFAVRHPHGFDLATDWTNGDGR